MNTLFKMRSILIGVLLIVTADILKTTPVFCQQNTNPEIERLETILNALQQGTNRDNVILLVPEADAKFLITYKKVGASSEERHSLEFPTLLPDGIDFATLQIFYDGRIVELSSPIDSLQYGKALLLTLNKEKTKANFLTVDLPPPPPPIVLRKPEEHLWTYAKFYTVAVFVGATLWMTDQKNKLEATNNALAHAVTYHDYNLQLQASQNAEESFNQARTAVIITGTVMVAAWVAKPLINLFSSSDDARKPRSQGGVTLQDDSANTMPWERLHERNYTQHRTVRPFTDGKKIGVTISL